MNKKFLSVVLFGALMAGSSVTFTGCIDNDEPAGIEELRGAKAELIRAKVAVEAANAARENANAALILAQAEVQKAKADYYKAQAAQEQAIADSMAAQTEAEKVRFEKLIAKYKQEMEEAALRHDSTMVALKESLAIAERSYELAVKQIEIAKAILSDEDSVKLETLQTALDTAQKNVNKAAENVADAEDAVYEIMLLKAQGLAVDSVGNTIKKTVVAKLEKNVERDSIALVGAQYELDRLNQYAEKDPKVADWVAEIKELDDSISGLRNVIEAYDVELAKFKNSQEVLDAKQAKEDAQTKLDELTEAAKPENIEIPAYSYTYKFEVANGAEGGQETNGNLNHGTYGRDKFELSVNNASVLDDVKDELTWAKDELAKYTAERIGRLEKLATDGVTSKEDYEGAVKAWKTAKDKYESASAYEDDKALETLWNAVKDNIAPANNGGDVTKQAAARLAIAKALTTYYTNAKVVDLTTKDVTLNMSIGGAPATDIKHTAAEWFADATYGGAYLASVLQNVNSSTDVPTVETDFKTLFAETGKIVKDKKKVSDFLTDVQDKSGKAFGTSMLVKFGGEEGYMLTEPTETEVLSYIDSEANSTGSFKLGWAGTYYADKRAESTQEYKNYKEWMADLKVAIPSLEAEVKLIEDAIEAAETAVTDAKIASDKAAAEYDAMIETGTKELAIAKKLAETKEEAATKVRSALLSALGTYSEVTGTFNNLDDFTEELKKQIAKAEDALYTAIEKLADSRVDLQKVLDGRYDAEAMAREQLAKEMAALEAAQKAYETALKNVEIALQIMAGDASAE